MTRHLVLLACCAAMLSTALPGTTSHLAQAAQTATKLTVTGDVGTPLSLAPDELKSMPRTTVEVKSENGNVAKYEGVLAGEILKRAGATLGSEMRGPAVSTYVVATARDGYQVVFSLAELDPAFTGSEILIADTIDGKPLTESQGPLRIVVPKDALPARSIRMLERLEVVRLKKAS